MLKLRIPNDVRRTYVVGLARTGSLTVSTVSETLGGSPVDVDRAVNTLTEAVRNVCASDPSGPCPTERQRGAGAAAALGRDAAAPSPPPTCPVIGKINKPWVGTQPVPARPNIAATTCDKAELRPRRRTRARATRTFLIPQARLPKRFGIAETVGAFAIARQGARARAQHLRGDGGLREEGPRRRGEQRGGPAARLPRLGVRPVAPRQRDQRQDARSASGWGSPASGATLRR